MRTAEEQSLSQGQWLLLVLITLLAVVLRIIGLAQWSFWVDEAHTYRDVVSSLEQFSASHVSRYPLSYLLLRGLSGFLPSMGEGWMRLPFAIFGMASIPLLVLLAKRMVGTRAALWAGLFLAICPWHIYWSQNARSYAMMMFFAMLGVLGCYHALTRRRSSILLPALVSLTIAGFCHPSGYLALVACLVFSCAAPLLPGQTKQSKRAYALPVLGVLVIVCMLPILLPNLEYAQRAKPDGSFLHVLQTSVFFLRGPMIIACIAGLVFYWREHARRAFFLGLWAFLPFALLGFVSAVFFKATAQYGFCSLPAVCLLAGIAAAEFQARMSKGAMQWILGLVLVADMASYDYFYFTIQSGDRPRWREAMQLIIDSDDPARLLLTSNMPGALYYLNSGVLPRAGEVDTEVISIEPWDVEVAGSGEDFMTAHRDRARQEGKTLYVILTHPELAEKDVDGSCEAWLRANSRQLLDLPSWIGPKDMSVLVYRVDA